LGLEGGAGTPVLPCAACTKSLITKEGNANRLLVRKSLRFMCNGFYKYESLPVTGSGKKATSISAMFAL
jgi:hypothetical protein